MNPLLISANKLSVGYLKKKVLGPISFECHSMTALIGANGSGKSTLLKAILGEANILSGQINYSMTQIPNQKFSNHEISQLFSYVPQEPIYPSQLKVLDYLKLSFLSEVGFFKCISKEHSDKLDEWIKLFSISHLIDRRLGFLSSGERQRIFLLSAFLKGSRCLILDEPTNHLDPGGSDRIFTLLEDLSKRFSMATIVSTHDLNFVRNHCNHVIALKNGNILFQGKAKLTEDRFKELYV